MFSTPLIPVQATEFAKEYDLLFYVILALSVFFTLVVCGAVLFLAIRYRRGSKVDRSHPPHENLKLEITWSVIPLILGLWIFAWGATQFVNYKRPPADCMDIYVVGKQWMWHFQHGQSGVRENNTLHVPLGKDVRLVMISQDVIHALFIPEFRVQYQVVPGRYTQVWFKATKVGKYHLFCNMYCGVQHSEMGGYVYVMKPDDYAKWIANGGNDPLNLTSAQRGSLVFKRMVCGSCHGPQDDIHGPSLYNLYGKQVALANGTKVKADDDYIRNAILKPYDATVAGYGNEMPQYDGQIDERDVFDLIDYIKTLGLNPTLINGNQAAVKGIPAPSMATGEDRQLSVGALHSEDPKSPGTTNEQLAVGALSTQREKD